jgi:hypothetical protein
MKHTFEHAELSDGAGAGEQGEKHLRDETDWLRTDDEDRPKQRRPFHPR